ncbi:hypothetical protein C0J52_27751 [Blattella germanica]|nr:hypothetical protein C0J52_27751 [Blattella germanica]
MTKEGRTNLPPPNTIDTYRRCRNASIASLAKLHLKRESIYSDSNKNCSAKTSQTTFPDMQRRIITVQRNYRREYGENAPDGKTIKAWCEKFLATGSVKKDQKVLAKPIVRQYESHVCEPAVGNAGSHLTPWSTCSFRREANRINALRLFSAPWATDEFACSREVLTKPTKKITHYMYITATRGEHNSIKSCLKLDGVTAGSPAFELHIPATER